MNGYIGDITTDFTKQKRMFSAEDLERLLTKLAQLELEIEKEELWESERINLNL